MSKTNGSPKTAKQYSHKELVERAARWLWGVQRCTVVLKEPTSGYGDEYPDAIGWQGNWSILIECKTSRADFRADAKKWSRDPKCPSLGVNRYYLTSKGLLAPTEMPAGWGLLECRGRGLQVVRPATPSADRALAKELRLVVGQFGLFRAGLGELQRVMRKSISHLQGEPLSVEAAK